MLIRSLKFLYNMLRYSNENPPKVDITDSTYIGLENKSVPLKIFHARQPSTVSLIIFPGASPLAEEHPGLKYLAGLIAKSGNNVIIPRIPPLKMLNISTINVDWFAHAYDQIRKRPDVDDDNLCVIGISYGGPILLRATLDNRMAQHPPKSIFLFGSCYDFKSSLNFLLTGEINDNGKILTITPSDWGLSVLLHNYLNRVDLNYDTHKLEEILLEKVMDNMDLVAKKMDTLNNSDREFLENVFKSNITPEILEIVYKILKTIESELKEISPSTFCHQINNKVFILHGINDNMIPFTESVKLSEKISNSTLFISHMHEHKEISKDHGIFFKMKELIKMKSFFEEYFRFNET